MVRELLGIALKTYPFQVAWILLLTVSQALVTGLGLGLILPIIDSLQSPSNVNASHPISEFFVNVLTVLHLPVNLWVLFISGLTLYSLQALLQYLRTVQVAKTSVQVEAGLRVELFSALVHAQLGYFNRNRMGDLVNGMVTEAHRGAMAFQHLINTLVSTGLVVAHLLIAIVISWQLSLILFAIAVPLIYVTRGRQRILDRGQEISQGNDALQGVASESLLGIKEMKIFGLESYITRVFRQEAENLSHQNWLLQRLSARFKVAYEVVAVVLLFGFVGLSFFVLRSPATEIVAFLAIMLRLSPAITQVQTNRDKLLGTVPGFGVVRELCRSASGRLERTGSSPQNSLNFQSAIDLRDVSFIYEGNNTPALRNIDLKITQGKSTALVGESGAGKSTLVDLIVGFYEPTQGQILVDGTDLKELDLVSWRQTIGFVSQDALLFNDTVLQNIRYGDLEATEEEVVAAARVAHAHEFIMELPQGYHTGIGDRGVKLSGGQRQRLALARAILRDPQILILDEATSDLDTKSESLIQQSLQEISRNRTVIVIAHRLSTIEDADEIVVLEGGQVVERGDHETLLRNGRHYREYHDLQFAKEPSMPRS